MSHSHIPVQHLLKQVELYKAKRNNRDVRPGWVTEFVEQVAELFEPLEDDGRVGFDCQLCEQRWQVSLFLGATEQVGGQDDGRLEYANFQFDLKRLLDCFEEIDRFRWTAYPAGLDGEDETSPSSITLDGRVAGESLRLQIHSHPPQDAGPGFRRSKGGRSEPS